MGYYKLFSFFVYPTLQKARDCARIQHMHVHIDGIWKERDFITDRSLNVPEDASQGGNEHFPWHFDYQLIKR